MLSTLSAIGPMYVAIARFFGFMLPVSTAVSWFRIGTALRTSVLSIALMAIFLNGRALRVAPTITLLRNFKSLGILHDLL